MSAHAKLYFEDYVRIFSNQEAGGLTDQLNKILSIHGLRQQKHKSEVLEVFHLIEMTDPNRSTLKEKDKVYPCAALSLEEVRADVRSMEWEECPLGSIMAVGYAADKKDLKNLSRPIGATVTVGSADKDQISTTTANSSSAAADIQKKKKKTNSNKQQQLKKQKEINPSRPISISDEAPRMKKKLKKNLSPQTGAIVAVDLGDDEENLIHPISSIPALTKSQQKRNRKLLAEVECSLFGM